MADKELQDCIISAERFLALREHNRKELETKLSSKKVFSKQTISRAIGFLVQSDELNEERYVRSFVRSNNKRHPEGRRIVFCRLAEKGADREVCSDVLDEIYTPEYTEELSRTAFEKYFFKYGDELKVRQKLAQSGLPYPKAHPDMISQEDTDL